MRHSNVGPAANSTSNAKPKPAGVVSPTSVSSPSQQGQGQGHVSSHSTSAVRVFASDVDAFPLAVFESSSSVHHVLATLRLANGGLKVKGGADTFMSDEAKLAAGDYVVIGSAGLRLRVLWKGNKLMVPYPFPSHQVQQLMEEIASRFTRFHTGDTELKMSELRTLDGYLINKYDRIMEAIHDEDQLEAIDFDTWLKEQAQLCKEPWLQVRQTDFVDNSVKWAIVGKHTHGKLFVQTGNGKQVDRLELFELEDLKMFAKEGQQQILTSKGKAESFEWHASASFSVNAAGQVTAVILEVESLSDSRPVIKELGVSIENGQIVKGAVKTIQLSEETAEDTLPKPLPAAKRTEVLIIDQPRPTEVAPMSTAQGVQKLKIEQVEQVFADQSWARDGVFNNNFYLHFSFTNPGDTVVTIAKVRTEYEVGANNWVAAKDTAIGYKAGFYDYRWNWNVSNFSIEKHSVEKVAILCSIPIKGAQVDRLRRAHRSLPHPLKIRTTFEDDQGAMSSIEIIHYNDDHKLPTKESVEKYNNKTYDFWAQLDDIETETRQYIAIVRALEDGREHLEIKNSVSSTTNYFYRDDLQRYAFEGVRNKQDIVEIPNLKASSHGAEIEVYAMVDQEKKRVYALKLIIKANGAYLEDYYRVKPLLNNT